MKINQAGVELIKQFEGFSAKPYLCPAKVWTIGYGHTGGVTKLTPPITKSEAEQILRDDLCEYEYLVKSLVLVPLNENQFSALVSLVFNVGVTPLTHTMGKLLNKNDYLGAAQQFERWCHVRSTVVFGLVRRRAAEKDLFLKRLGG